MGQTIMVSQMQLRGNPENELRPISKKQKLRMQTKKRRKQLQLERIYKRKYPMARQARKYSQTCIRRKRIYRTLQARCKKQLISGGTSTKMSPEEFEAALRKSFLFWHNKALLP